MNHTYRDSDLQIITRDLFQRDLLRQQQQTDRMFGWLLLVQWTGAVLLALWTTPLTWSGDQSAVHPHVWTALFLVGGLTLLPVTLTRLYPGRSFTRHAVAAAQMMTSAVLIHLTGGRLETHFHIFGSLAFLALYRDWTVIATATALVVIDHGARGFLWPESIYGVAHVDFLRTLEHGFWVVFEDIVLVYSGIKSRREMWVIAGRQAELTLNNITIEDQVQSRTRDLKVSRDQVAKQAEVLAAQTVELIQARDLAEEASRVKSEFLANMSHEIRTPLTAIMGYTDILRGEGDFDHSEAQTTEAIETIRSASKHLLAVINDILDLSKIEAKHLELEQARIMLPGLLQEIESLLRPRALNKGVTLSTKVLHAIPSIIIADPTRLRQVLMNLIGNSVKFTEYGQVTIEVDLQRSPRQYLPGQAAEQVDFSEKPQLIEWLQVDIRDTGPGMSESLVKRLFSAFTQADSSTSRRFGGTGLGLKISRQLARLMGGDVVLHSTELGRGSCFRVMIPLTVEPGCPYVNSVQIASESKQDKKDALPLKTNLNASILLVEDGFDNQRLIGMILRNAGAEVEIAENGLEALEWIALRRESGQPFDLILTDMQMPVLDGYGLAQELRSRGETLPIVALTAHAMAEDRRRCLDAGCDDYSTKPINRHQLLQTIQMWLQKKPNKNKIPTANARK
jgi:signal transduction histidine kinase/ActR/RegA family two-component response regulator